MAEKYPFTPEQMEKIRKQGELLGQDKIREVEQEWPELIAMVKAEMEKGTPPDKSDGVMNGGALIAIATANGIPRPTTCRGIFARFTRLRMPRAGP